MWLKEGVVPTEGERGKGPRVFFDDLREVVLRETDETMEPPKSGTVPFGDHLLACEPPVAPFLTPDEDQVRESVTQLVA